MGWGDAVGCQAFLRSISENELGRRASEWVDFSPVPLTLPVLRQAH